MSKVSSTAGMFASSYKFNGDVSTWDMSNNRDYTGMFKNCVSFSQDLAAWNVRNAESFRDMFSGAGLFAGKGLSNWSVSEWLHDSAYMFLDATSFNGNISSWDVSRVQFMESMVCSDRIVIFSHCLFAMLSLNSRVCLHSSRAQLRLTRICRCGIYRTYRTLPPCSWMQNRFSRTCVLGRIYSPNLLWSTTCLLILVAFFLWILSPMEHLHSFALSVFRPLLKILLNMRP